jgi:hypothetical protein
MDLGEMLGIKQVRRFFLEITSRFRPVPYLFHSISSLVQSYYTRRVQKKTELLL